MRQLQLHALVVLFPLIFGIGRAEPASADGAPNYPNRTIRIIVPFPAGGPTDINARIIAQKMSEHWNQPVVIENRPGANTALGAQVVARAEPDGYTLLAAMDTTLVMNPATSTHLSYDPFKDFATVTLTASNTSLLTVRAADGPQTVLGLIDRAKANPGKLNYGAGVITTRLAGYLFAHMAGIHVQLVPYKGSSDTVQGLLSGSVDFIVDGIAASLPLIKAATGSPRRTATCRRGQPAAARGYFHLDRARRSGRHTARDHRQDLSRSGRAQSRSGRAGAIGAGRDHASDQHSCGI